MTRRHGEGFPECGMHALLRNVPDGVYDPGVRLRVFAWFVAVAIVPAVSAFACSSLPDLHFDEDGQAPEAGGDTVATDGPKDGPVDGCKPSGPEVCDDGIDNDCNGHADCDDPACAAFQCEPPTPSGGWAPVAFADTTSASCPSGWGAQTDVKFVAGDGTDGSCVCSCSGSGGAVATCNAGTTGFTLYNSNACATSTSTQNLPAQNATCTAFGTPLDAPSNTFATVTAPSGPTTCAKNTVLTKNNVADGRTCAAPAKLGGGCAGGQVCAPKPAGLRYCVAKSGLNACPAPFTVRRRAGTDATDARACNDASCNCNVAACAATVNAFSNANCTGGTNVALTSAMACPASDFGVNGKIKAYTTSVTGGCGVAAGFSAGVVGNVTFTGDETICCTN